MISDVKIKNIWQRCSSICWDEIIDVCYEAKIAVITRYPSGERLTMRKDSESFYYLRNKYGSFVAEVASIRRDILRQLWCSGTR